jgi:hypothetical protein
MSGTIGVSDLGMGKTVKGSDGAKVGVINEVVETPSASPDSPASYYFEVDRGGFLGIGSSHLYIPINVVADAQGKDDVILTCTAEEAGQKYQQQPGKNDGSSR